MSLNRVLQPPRSLHPQGRITDQLVEARSRIAAQERGGPTPRISIPLSTNWVPFGSTYQSPYYYVDRGHVYLEGLIKANAAFAASVVVFTMPVGFRPPGDMIFLCGSSGTNAVIGTLTTNGNFVVNQAYSSGGWFSVSQVRYRL